MSDRLPCGCPEIETYLDPCPEGECVWSHWHPSPIDGLREDRFCFYCGAMETQRICGEDHR